MMKFFKRQKSRMKIFYKVRKCTNKGLSLHVAWGGFKPLTASTEMGESQSPIFIGFGATEHAAIGDLQSGLDVQGVTEWEKMSL